MLPEAVGAVAILIACGAGIAAFAAGVENTWTAAFTAATLAVISAAIAILA